MSSDGDPARSRAGRRLLGGEDGGAKPPRLCRRAVDTAARRSFTPGNLALRVQRCNSFELTSAGTASGQPPHPRLHRCWPGPAAEQKLAEKPGARDEKGTASLPAGLPDGSPPGRARVGSRRNDVGKENRAMVAALWVTFNHVADGQQTRAENHARSVRSQAQSPTFPPQVSLFPVSLQAEPQHPRNSWN